MKTTNNVREYPLAVISGSGSQNMGAAEGSAARIRKQMGHQNEGCIMNHRKLTGNTITALAVMVLLVAGGRVQAATLAAFNFDSASGLAVTDISGNGHTANFTAFDGLSNDDPFSLAESKSVAISVPVSQAFLANAATIDLNNGGLNQFTMEGWIKPAAYGFSTLMELRNNAAPSTFMLGMRGDSHIAEAIFKTPGSGLVELPGSSALPLNQWSHLAVTYDGGTLRLYVDASQVNSVAISQALPSSMDLGLIGGGTIFGQFNGLIDDVRFSNSVLAPSELGYFNSFTILVPEPTSVALLILGLTILRLRRSR